MTAADAGVSGGAALVVMGDARLIEFLPDPQLTRLAQRIQQNMQIRPMSEPELRGYLMHCFRLAGGDFEQAFAPDAAAAIRGLSQGIPRVANKVVEAAMFAAAANDTKPVGAELVAEVARKEFGLKATSKPASVAGPRVEPPLETATAAEDRTPDEPGPDLVILDETREDSDEEIPELFQDTLPDLEILVTKGGNSETRSIESPTIQLPDWEKDPTLAELVPDLVALEKAMSVARSEAHSAAPPIKEDAIPVLEAEPVGQDEAIEEIPEITLDNAIRQRVDDNLIDEPGSVSTSPNSGAAESDSSDDVPDIMMPSRSAKKADVEIERISAELARAKALDDVDAKLAETLFGEEFSLAAAKVAAMVQAEQSANDESLRLNDTNAAQMAQALGSPANDAVAEGEVAIELQEKKGGPDLSATQRLNTVRSFRSNEPVARIDPTEAARRAAPSPERPTPDPIEDQINTSMTQTLKALDVRPPILDRTARFEDDDNDDDDESLEESDKKEGFFSRFRRS